MERKLENESMLTKCATRVRTDQLDQLVITTYIRHFVLAVLSADPVSRNSLHIIRRHKDIP